MLNSSQKIALFDELKTWEERYQHVMDLGSELPIQNETFKTAKNRVTGCQSRVWITVDFNDGLCLLTAESDALLVRGLLYIIKNMVDGKTPSELADLDFDIAKNIGLEGKLSLTRLNGISAVVNKIKEHAKSHQQNN